MLFCDSEIAALEALLFMAKEPLTVARLAEILEISSTDVEELLPVLMEKYTSDSCGLMLLKIENGYRLGTKPEMARYVEVLYKQPTQALSNAALEVLSIIAYKQPITRGEIDFIRGVQSDRALATLTEKGLVRETGRKEGPGRPILYVTTDKFLWHFGFSSLSELPEIKLEPERGELTEE